MALSKIEWKNEYERLKKVTNIIDNNIEYLENKIRQSLGQIKKSNKDMWEQTKSYHYDLDDVIEALTYLDGINSDKMRHENEVSQLKKLLLLKKNAYFGRLDFIEEDYSDTDKIYIGTSTLDSTDGDIIIYDWRAAICSMFYEQEKGNSFFKSPEGTVNGEILLKRQYRIFYTEIQSMFESSIKIDDEILQAILSESKDSKMGHIIASIQKEQNQAIRNEKDKIVIVDGPAGSGKTSIALHRIAWLLYRYRETIKPKNVIVYSPNEIFNDYISDVLPELGEENMKMSTFINLAHSYFGNKYRLKGKYHQMESILSNLTNEKSQAIKIKGSYIFANNIEKYIKKLEKGLFEFTDIIYEGKYIASKDELTELFYNDYSMHKLALRFEKLRTLLHKRLNNLIIVMRQEYLRIPRMDYERRKKAVYTARNAATILRELIDNYTRPDVTKIYHDFLVKNENINFAKQFNERLAKRIIIYEDIAPLMLVKSLMGYKNRIKNMKHVVIDEVQDYSVVELLVLTELYKNCSFTVLGDTNQAINYLTGLDTLDELTIKDAFLVKLTKSYRSTKQITEFCTKILGDVYKYEYVDRIGDIPNIIKASHRIIDNVKVAVKSMQDKNCKSIAIITRTARTADFVFNRLNDLEVNRVRANDETYIRGTVVLPSYLSKGLEYDGVILVCKDHDNYKGEKDKKLLYTCCSRALHNLTIIYENTRPDFI